MHSFFFYFFSLTMILASLAVVLARNPLYNVLGLVVVIFSLSSLFILLEAFFVGIILLLVYAGAVMIFFLFVVMCLNLSAPSILQVTQSRFRLWGILGAVTFFASSTIAFKSLQQAMAIGPSTVRGTIESMGMILFTDYLLPFELTSFLLLIAIFGIVSLAKGALKQ